MLLKDVFSLGILAGVRLFGGYFVDYVRKRVVVTANFDSRDESYRYIT